MMTFSNWPSRKLLPSKFPPSSRSSATATTTVKGEARAKAKASQLSLLYAQTKMEEAYQMQAAG